MFARIIRILITLIYEAHERILTINDNHSFGLDDKQLHFVVIGITGMLMFFLVNAVFRWCMKHQLTMVPAWIYVFTCMIVLTFAIEIGQWYSGTGNVEMADVAAGLAGFLAFFAVFLAIYGLIKLIGWLWKRTGS